MGTLVVSDLRETFQGKRVLVTGSTGFKGSWLACWLKMLGAEVFGYALEPERNIDHFCVIKLGEHILQEYGDIRDYPHLSDFMRGVAPTFVFHLAAQPLVRRSYQEPKLTVDTNVGGSVNLLEAVRHTPSVRALIYITSDKSYRNREWCWGYRENDELGGKDPYSASKAAAEIIFSAYVSSFFKNRPDFGAASTRAGNVIGGGDWSQDRIVPDCIRALKNRQPIRLRSPKATRPWQHVLEPLSGYLVLAWHLIEDPNNFNEAFNFGPESSTVRTVRELAEIIIHEWGSGSLEVAQDESDYHEAGMLHLNCDKAQQLLGWRPRWGFKETVEKTVAWYRQSMEGIDPLIITRTQIEEYMERWR
jgi:CDP-glucose 4,6-dehydratase